MTFTPQIRVRGHDDSPLKRHTVFLMIRGEKGTMKQTLTTDDEGLAAFELDTANWDGKGISLEVSTGRSSFPGRKASLKENVKIFLFPPLHHHPPPLGNSISPIHRSCPSADKKFFLDPIFNNNQINDLQIKIAISTNSFYNLTPSLSDPLFEIRLGRKKWFRVIFFLLFPFSLFLLLIKITKKRILGFA